MAIFGENGLVQRHELRQRRVEVQRQIAEAELYNASLRRQVRLMERDPLAVRRLVAEELMMAPENSTIYVFAE
jgi:cell division protein FtsB